MEGPDVGGFHVFLSFFTLRAYRGPLFLDQPASQEPRSSWPAGRPAKINGPAEPAGRLINDRVGRAAGLLLLLPLLPVSYTHLTLPTKLEV